MRNTREKNKGTTNWSGGTLATADSIRRLSKVAEAPGAVSVEALEQKMVDAARSEALSLAWLSGKPQKAFPVLLDLKIRQAKEYVRRQQFIRGQSERIFSTAF